MSIIVDVSVEAGGWKKNPDADAIVTRAVEAVLNDASIGDAEVGVVLCDDARIRELNRIWRDKDKPTNVLSFPVGESPNGETKHYGDIVLAYETLTREAESEEKSFEAHLSHLTVHGMLHLLGFDHENDGDADQMEDRERKILDRLGIADPYANGERMEHEHA